MNCNRTRDSVLITRPVRHVPRKRNAKKVEAVGLPDAGESAKDILSVEFATDKGAGNVDVSLAVLREES